MQVRTGSLAMVLAAATAALSAGAFAQAAPQAGVAVSQVQNVGQESAPLRVMVDKSLLVRTADPIKRVSVTDPAVADAIAITPTQILVHGRAPGEVSLILWNQEEQSRTFDLRVDVDVTAASNEIHHALPDQKIEVGALRNALVLTGHVISKDDATRAAEIASAFSKNVVNALTFGPVGAQEVLLEVKFAEVDRTALMQLGFNLFSTGATNTFGTFSTQQFGGFTGARTGAVTSDVQAPQAPPGSATATGELRNQLLHQPASIGMNDLLNFFLFRTDINLGAVVKALQQKNVLQILAEPNLIAMNGKEASFLAGGEFPFPIVQGAAGLQSVTIQFKEFGVRLSFVPMIMPNGDIHLSVKPEVSALDFTNALSISGFVIPALSTRRASTEFEMKDGQSFIIAGLMDNRVTNVIDKVPGLGDIPILGTFFKSKNNQKSTSELMVLVTAKRVSPATAPVALPTFPEKFLQKNVGPAGR
ncbi:MAG: type II and III secretion system protein family protein [Terriglobales bacterium]